MTRHESRRRPGARRGERGAALVEFTIGALVFLTATFGVIEFSRLLWTHNALSDAARRGARYAVTHPSADETVVKNIVVFGNEAGTGNPIATGLTTGDVDVDYTASPVTGVFGYPEGSVTVTIDDYQFNFVVPIVGTTLTMPDYRTTLTAESAGMIPPDITPTPTPGPTATPTPSTTPTPASTPTPAPTATPTPAPTATPTPAPSTTPTPVPSPTPRSCRSGERPGTGGCVCRSPMTVGKNGKCG
jgi:Flp pilus assembly protein TadG